MSHSCEPFDFFFHYLDRIESLLNKVEASSEPTKIFMYALAEDMFPLGQQLTTAIDFALRTCCPLAGHEVVSFYQGHETIGEVRSQLQQTKAFLAKLDQNKLREAPSVYDIHAGQGRVELEKDAFVWHFSVPNFLFHYSMAYAIARKSGLDVGKSDFDGLHQYEPGFSFL